MADTNRAGPALPTGIGVPVNKGTEHLWQSGTRPSRKKERRMKVQTLRRVVLIGCISSVAGCTRTAGVRLFHEGSGEYFGIGPNPFRQGMTATEHPDWSRLQGKWDYVVVLRHGREFPVGDGAHITVAGHKQIIHRNNLTLETWFEIDPSSSPKRMRAANPNPTGRGPLIINCIYKLEGDVYRRPTPSAI